MESTTATQIPNPRPDLLTEPFLQVLGAAGATEAWLFGSVSRGEERPESDIDLLVTFGRKISLFERMDLADELSRLAGRKVDSLANIHPAIEPYICPTLVPIPL